MLKASNLKKGNIVLINGHPYQAKQIDVQTPSARGANTLYKVRFAAIPSGQKLEQAFKGNDTLDEVDLERRPINFLYKDRDFFTFMDTDNYEQYTLAEELLGEQALWLSEGLEGITALLLSGNIIAIELPASVDLEIAETAPVIKGATATNRNKPAVLSNGVTVLVPEYLAAGEVVRINIELVRFMSRVKE
ncbi:MAG: elongation factor P-like protein YeiP [Desulfobacterales bacterium]|nr:elongation factor P-like protein YeiP [Desulfobacterales bacterium]